MSALRRRGQPLAMLALVLAGWMVGRAALWEPPFALRRLLESFPPDKPAPGNGPIASTQLAGLQEQAPTALKAPLAPSEAWRASADPPSMLNREPALPLAAGTLQTLPPSPRAPPPAAASRTALPAHGRRAIAAHQLLSLAALARLPLPPGLALLAIPQRSAEPPRPDFGGSPPVLLPRRWSGDGWILVRQGSGGLAAASGFPAYGASQTGGVIRYALAPGSGHAPQAYARLSRALGGLDEGEVAAGLSARPFANLLLRLLGEARVQRSGGATRVRPAASLVSELPPVRLPLGVEGEGYAQAGYAGAPLGTRHGATPFFDVQAVAERHLAGAGPAELRVGAGAWGGGQKGAMRLDLGPRASARLGLGPARSRLTLDYRFRVAGDARPGSGPTLTFSAGF